MFEHLGVKVSDNSTLMSKYERLVRGTTRSTATSLGIEFSRTSLGGPRSAPLLRGGHPERHAGRDRGVERSRYPVAPVDTTRARDTDMRMQLPYTRDLVGAHAHHIYTTRNHVHVSTCARRHVHRVRACVRARIPACTRRRPAQ